MEKLDELLSKQRECSTLEDFKRLRNEIIGYVDTLTQEEQNFLYYEENILENISMVISAYEDKE